jgi:hypothetical protein
MGVGCALLSVELAMEQADSLNPALKPELHKMAGKLRFSHLPTRYSCR